MPLENHVAQPPSALRCGPQLRSAEHKFFGCVVLRLLHCVSKIFLRRPAFERSAIAEGLLPQGWDVAAGNMWCRPEILGYNPLQPPSAQVPISSSRLATEALQNA